jgi:putative resolvase
MDGSNFLGIARINPCAYSQKEDLKRQAEVLAGYCSKQRWNFQVIQDLGSGMNYQKKGLKALIQLILEREISRLVLTHKDRLLRFGAELIFALCEAKQIEVILINKGDEVSFEEELAQDVLEIITVFSARLYGSRSKKNKKLIEAAKVLIS